MSFWSDRSDDAGLQSAWQELAEQAKDKPWLLKLLAERGAALAARYALWKGRLGKLRQGERRRLQRRLGVSLAGAALLLALTGAPAARAGAPIVVDGTTCTLVDAITSANTDSIVGGCTTGYAGADTIDLQVDVTLSLPNNTTYGYTGLPPVISEITIEGNGHSISRSPSTVQFRVMAVGPGGSLSLNNATISGGATSGVTPDGGGGGIFATSATLVVSNSTISGNFAEVDGGGLYAAHGAMTVVNSTLYGNTCSDDGGAIYGYNASVTVQNSTLSGNSAFDGAAINIGRDTWLSVSDSTIADNTSKWGGGVYVYEGQAEVVNTTLSGNYATYYGGAIWAGTNYSAYIATVEVSNSTLSGNTAGALGGGIYNSQAVTTVTNSTLSGNSAGRYGGGVFGTYYSTITIQRSLVSGNTASLAGNEVYHDDRSTVYGGSYNLFGHDGEDNAAAFYGFAPSGSDINATTDGDSVALATILNTTLADNDSTVVSGIPPGAVVQTLALPTGSPALDKAPSADCVAPTFDLDQRGKPRNVDGDGSASSNECDIGAFERQLATGAVPRIVIQKQTRPDGDTTAFKFNLRGPASRSFTLSDNGIKSTGQIPAGIYSLEEILPAGWTPAIPLDQLTCDDGSLISAIDLGASEVVVCRFLNFRGGNLIIKKVTIPPMVSPSFAMRLINNATSAKQNFSLANGQQFDSGPLDSSVTYKVLETIPGGWKKKNIVCDNGSPSTAIVPTAGATVTCTVTNENTPPANILLSATSVAENKAIGTLVGNLSATDSVAGDTHTFSFVNDGTAAAANNGNFQLAGNQLKTAKKFDFETKSSHNIKLMVTDSAGQTKVKAFVITIIDGPN